MAATESIPSWLPDWRDEKAYPDPEQMIPSYWGWQFLRRNRAYQTDYAVFAALPDDDGDCNITGKWKGRPWLDGLLDCFYCDPLALPGETLRQYLERLGNAEWEIIPYQEWLCRKWGIEPIIHDPADDSPFAIGPGADEYMPPIIDYAGVGLQPERQGQVCVMFDLAFGSIEDQLKSAGTELTEMRKLLDIAKAPAVQMQQGRLYVEYLRILDAVDSGITQTEVAKTLYENHAGTPSALVRDRLRAARKIVEGGYRALFVK